MEKSVTLIPACPYGVRPQVTITERVEGEKDNYKTKQKPAGRVREKVGGGRLVRGGGRGKGGRGGRRESGVGDARNIIIAIGYV